VYVFQYFDLVSEYYLMCQVFFFNETLAENPQDPYREIKLDFTNCVNHSKMFKIFSLYGCGLPAYWTKHTRKWHGNSGYWKIFWPRSDIPEKLSGCSQLKVCWDYFM